MPAHQPLDAALVLGLELVVELLADPLAQLREQPFRVQSRGEPLDERQQQRRVAQVSLDRLRHPGVLDLHDDVVAVDRGGAVDLADRGRGKRTLVEVGEHALERAAELLPHELLELGEGHRWDVVAEGGELALQLVLLVLVEAVELDHRDDLADLHRRAAHLPKLVDQLVDERCGPLVLGGGGPLGRPDPVRGAHTGPAQALPGHQPVGSFPASGGGSSGCGLMGRD